MANSFEGIRYFATNRDMENLRQLRGDRVSLWSGGYFFIDMCRYVPHFMETVQERSLPEHCIVQNSDDAVFREFIAHPKVGAVAICVHGFNVALHESYFWFRTLTDTLRSAPGLRDRFVCDATEIHGDRGKRLKDEGKKLEDGALIACIGFSWPSDGAVLSYLSDQREAVGSASALANLVSRIHVWEPAGEPRVPQHGQSPRLPHAFGTGRQEAAAEELRRHPRGRQAAPHLAAALPSCSI
jgi:hypothetical protein